MLTWYINTLVCSQNAIVLYFSIDRRPLDTYYLHIDGTVIKEHIISHFQILSNIGV